MYVTSWPHDSLVNARSFSNAKAHSPVSVPCPFVFPAVQARKKKSTIDYAKLIEQKSEVVTLGSRNKEGKKEGKKTKEGLSRGKYKQASKGLNYTYIRTYDNGCFLR